MTRIVVVSVMTLWGASFLTEHLNAQNQGTNTGSPSAPTTETNSPTLQVTTQFIQDKLLSHGDVSFGVVSRSSNSWDRENGSSSQTSRVIGAIANPSTCTFDISIRSVTNGPVMNRIQGSFRDIKEITVLDSATMGKVTQQEFTPQIFFLTIKAETPAFKNLFTDLSPEFSVDRKGKQVKNPGHMAPTETQDPQETFVFRDEDLANRVAKAFSHAAELCGAGNKNEPF